MNKIMTNCIMKHCMVWIAGVVCLLFMLCQTGSAKESKGLTESEVIQISEKILSEALGRSVVYSTGHCTFSLDATYYPIMSVWNVHQIGKYNEEMYYGSDSFSPYVVLDAQTGEIKDINLYPMAENSVFPLEPSVWLETAVYGNMTTSDGKEISDAVLYPEYGNPCYLFDSLITAINGTVVSKSSSEICFSDSSAELFAVSIHKASADKIVLSMSQREEHEKLSDSWNGKMDAFYFQENIYISNDDAKEFLFYFNRLLNAGEKDNRNACVTEACYYQDVSLRDWYGKSIYYLDMQSATSGYTDENYYPLQAITRAEFVSMIAECSGEDLSIYSKEQPVFIDTGDRNIWWHTSIQWAYNKEICSGVGYGKFEPDSPISRQEAAAILSRYLKHKGMHISVSLPLSFKDSDLISSWAAQSVEQCRRYGIFEGTDENLFLPQNTLTRGEAACIVYRVCVYMDYINSDNAIQNKNEIDSVKMDKRTYIPDRSAQFETETIHFFGGNEIYKTVANEDMPFSVRGIMSIPKEGKDYPLVIILHGSHDNENTDAKLYEGFQYLTEAIAEHGFAAVALDVQPAFVWKYGDADDGEKVPYILDKFLQYLSNDEMSQKMFRGGLAERIANDKIILIGHSRGGDYVLDYAASHDSVIGVLAVAPAGGRLTDSWRDIPTAMVVSELDGDVVFYSAYSYRPAIKAAGLTSPSVISLVDGANHNYYNEKLLNDDASICYSDADLANRITPEQQRKFLMDYASSFCNFCVNGIEKGSLFDLTQPALNELSGVRMRSIYGGGTFSDCYVVDKNLESETLHIEKLFESESIYKDTMECFESGMSDIDVLYIGWDKNHGSIPVYQKDAALDGKNGIAVTFAVDPGGERNEQGVPQSFSIDVALKNGKMVEIILPDTLPQLTCMTGKLYENNYNGVDVKAWSRVTPPSAVLIPFEYYGINTADVLSVNLNFNQTDSGSIVLFSVELYD